jgi:pimeloyl-ACP methyl ester carboxylesterase
MWEAQTAYFSRGYTVLTPTLPGHHLHRQSSFTSHADAAEAVAGEVGLLDLSFVTVIGFSLGGQTAIQLAAAYPDHVQRLVVVSSLLRPWPGAGVIGLIAAATTPLSRSRRFARAQAAQLSIPAARFEDYYALSRSISAPTLRRLIQANFSFAVPGEVLDSTRPVLLMAGNKEEPRLLRGMEYFQPKFRNSSLQIHEGVGHGMPLAQPELFNASIGRWLETGDATGARL